MLSEPATVLLAGFFASLLFLTLGPYSNFSAAGYLDPWIYTGYFTNFTYLVHQYGYTYYVSRLPWILPGLLVYQAATPVVASVLLNTAILTASGVSLYWIVRWRYGPLPGVLSAAALVTNPYFMYTVAWDYPDGPAIAYAFVGAACWFRPNGDRARNAICAGAFLALSGYTNMACLPVLVAMLALPICRYWRSGRELAREAIFVAIGGTIVTVAFAIAGKVVLDRYVFFWAQIDQILYTMKHPDYLSKMWGTGNAFLATAFRLFLPEFLLIGGGAMLIFNRARKELMPAFLFLALSCVMLAEQEFIGHSVTLRVAYVGSYMLVPAFCFAGLLFGELWRGNETRWQTVLPAILGTILALALAVLRAQEIPSRQVNEVWIGMAILGAITALAVITASRALVLRYLSPLLLVGSLFVGPALDSSLAYTFSGENRQTFKTLMEIQDLIKSTVPPERHLRFWFDQDEPAAPLFNSAASLYLWGYYDLSRELPTASRETIGQYLTPDTTIVHLTDRPNKITQRIASLNSRGILVDRSRRWTLLARRSPLYIELDDVTDMRAAR